MISGTFKSLAKVLWSRRVGIEVTVGRKCPNCLGIVLNIAGEQKRPSRGLFLVSWEDEGPFKGRKLQVLP